MKRALVMFGYAGGTTAFIAASSSLPWTLLGVVFVLALLVAVCAMATPEILP